MDVFEATDDQEVCRKCGAKTEIIKVFPAYEFHLCPACQYQYKLLIEPDEFEDDMVEVDNTPSRKSADFWK